MDKDGKKVWYAGKASKEELDEIERCNLCRTMPQLKDTCYAREYCHRQLQMEIEQRGADDHEGNHA